MSGHRSTPDRGLFDLPGCLAANRRQNRNAAAHLPAYLERNMLAPRHWNPPGS